MPIKSENLTLHISKREVIVRFLVPKDYGLGECKSVELFLDKINQEVKSGDNKTLNALIAVVDEIIHTGLNCTKVVITDNLISCYISFEDFSHFDLTASKIRKFKELEKTCSVDYYLTQKIWFPYSIEIEENENLLSILGKILNHNFGPKTMEFYELVIPYAVPEVELVRARLEDNYLVLTIHSKENMLIEYYEEELFERYGKITDGSLID